MNPHITPRDLGLPQERFYDHQLWALAELEDRTERVLMLDAPTGSGKSLLCAAWARMNRRPLLYCCETITLQEQFLRAFPGSRMVMGRARYATRDYPNAYPDLNAGDCTAHDAEDTCRWCTPTENCPYAVAREEALDSDQAVLNVAYWLAACSGAHSVWDQSLNRAPYENHCWSCGGRVSSLTEPVCTTCGWFRCPTCGLCERGCPGGPYRRPHGQGRWVVLDEADLLERILLDHVSVAVPVATLGMGPTIVKNPTREGGKLADWGPWLQVAIQRCEEKAKDAAEQASQVRTARGAVKHLRAHRYWIETKDRVDTLLADLQAGGENWVLDTAARTYTFKPIRLTRELAHEALWSHGTRFLLMSGTLISKEAMCADLCLDPADVGWVSVPSTYPAENRRVYYWPAAEATYANQDESRPQLVAAADRILDAYPERTLIHTHSYDLARYMVARSRHSGRMVTHQDARDRGEALDLYRSTPGAVLVTPSLERGVDLPYDDCRCQIILKVPFPSLGDQQVSARLHAPGGQLWYTVQTIRSLVQMVGRSNRQPDDWSDTWIIDKSFSRMLRNFNLFPSYVREALVMDRGLITTRLVRGVRPA